MAGIGDFIGGAAKSDVAQQLFLWGVLYGLLGTVFEPVTTEIGQEVWEAAAQSGLHRALSPELLAVMVVRGWIDQATGEAEALKNGINQGDFGRMVDNARNPISPEEAAVALRRQLIPEDADPTQPSYLNAIRQGNLGDQWADVVKQLATQIPTPADILQAELEGQIPAGVDPRALYERVGGQATDPHDGFDWFQLMFDTRGSAPSPNEAATMANRGIIPWDGQGPGVTSFYQAFLEGPWRNKWEPAWRALAEYLPPPRTVVAMLRSGSLTPAQALTLLQKEGLTPELAQAYIVDATHTKATTQKQLSLTTVLAMYEAKQIDAPTATGFMENLGYTAAEADAELKFADYQRAHKSLTAAINRVAAAYLAKKIDSAQATTALQQLGVPADAVTQYIQTWEVERTTQVRLLTVGEITTAFYYQVFSTDTATNQATAMGHLTDLGYTAHDAWVILSARAKGPLPNEPAA